MWIWTGLTVMIWRMTDRMCRLFQLIMTIHAYFQYHFRPSRMTYSSRKSVLLSLTWFVFSKEPNMTVLILISSLTKWVLVMYNSVCEFSCRCLCLKFRLFNNVNIFHALSYLQYFCSNRILSLPEKIIVHYVASEVHTAYLY